MGIAQRRQRGERHTPSRDSRAIVLTYRDRERERMCVRKSGREREKEKGRKRKRKGKIERVRERWRRRERGQICLAQTATTYHLSHFSI